MLANDVAAAGAERAAQAGERRAFRNLASSRPTTLTRQTPRTARDADQHAVVALHDLVAVEPLPDVVERLLSGRGMRRRLLARA